jgi:hypothetical protein
MSPEDTKRLQEATQDLGFGRPTGSPQTPSATSEATPEPAAGASAEVHAESQPNPARAPQPNKAKAVAAKAAATASRPSATPATGYKDAALKISVPDDLWNSLRMEALKRRVTVKFLVLEALAAKGYDVDLDAIPEDGRRLR